MKRGGVRVRNGEEVLERWFRVHWNSPGGGVCIIGVWKRQSQSSVRNEVGEGGGGRALAGGMAGGETMVFWCEMLTEILRGMGGYGCMYVRGVPRRGRRKIPPTAMQLLYIWSKPTRGKVTRCRLRNLHQCVGGCKSRERKGAVERIRRLVCMLREGRVRCFYASV